MASLKGRGEKSELGAALMTLGASSHTCFHRLLAEPQSVPSTVSGWTATVRPPVSYTDRLKRQQMAAYGLQGQPLSGEELDHLVALELGGAPADVANLWPEPWAGDGNAHQKDAVENFLNREVCRGTMLLADVSGKPPSRALLAWSDTLDCSICALIRNRRIESPIQAPTAIRIHLTTRPGVIGLRGRASRSARRDSRSCSKPGSPARPGALNHRGRER